MASYHYKLDYRLVPNRLASYHYKLIQYKNLKIRNFRTVKTKLISGAPSLRTLGAAVHLGSPLRKELGVLNHPPGFSGLLG